MASIKRVLPYVLPHPRLRDRIIHGAVLNSKHDSGRVLENNKHTDKEKCADMTQVCGYDSSVWIVLKCADMTRMCGFDSSVWIILECVDNTRVCGYDSRVRI